MLNVIFYVMTDILKLVFGTFTSQAEVWKDPKITPNPTISSTLVIGDHSISHSVLLLAAVTAASQMGFKVVFFTQIQIQRLPASLQKYLPSLNPESLKVLITLLSVIVTVCYVLTNVSAKCLDCQVVK